MAISKIRIVMEGNPTNGNNIPLSEFVLIIDAFLKLLNETAKSETAKSGLKKNAHCDFLISNLSHSSPAYVEITQNSTEQSVAQSVFKSLIDQEQIIKSEKELSDGLLKRWVALAKYNEKLVSSCTIELFEDQCQVNSISISNIKTDILHLQRIPVKKQDYRTSVTGRVEIVDLHNQQLKVYPRVPQWNSVDVFFADQFADDVIKSIDKVVEISGMARHRSSDILPYEIKMESIRILPDEKDLPHLSDFEGAAPNITGGKTVQEFMDDIRKGWRR